MSVDDYDIDFFFLIFAWHRDRHAKPLRFDSAVPFGEAAENAQTKSPVTNEDCSDRVRYTDYALIHSAVARLVIIQIYSSFQSDKSIHRFLDSKLSDAERAHVTAVCVYSCVCAYGFA